MANGEAEYSRKRAQEMRERAATAPAENIRTAMLKVADEYEKLAKYASLWPPGNST